MERGEKVFVSEGFVRREAEGALASGGGVEVLGGRIEGPGAELAGMEGEIEPGAAVERLAADAIIFGHQAALLGLELGHAVALDGDVELGGDEVLRLDGFFSLRGAEDGGDHDSVPEPRTVLAVIQQVERDAAVLGDGVAQADDVVRAGVGALEEAAVAADDLRGGVARQPLESGVDEDDGVVGQARVADGHRNDGVGDAHDEGVARHEEGVEARDGGLDERMVSGQARGVPAHGGATGIQERDRASPGASVTSQSPRRSIRFASVSCFKRKSIPTSRNFFYLS